MFGYVTSCLCLHRKKAWSHCSHSPHVGVLCPQSSGLRKHGKSVRTGGLFCRGLGWGVVAIFHPTRVSLRVPLPAPHSEDASQILGLCCAEQRGHWALMHLPLTAPLVRLAPTPGHLLSALVCPFIQPNVTQNSLLITLLSTLKPAL